MEYETGQDIIDAKDVAGVVVVKKGTLYMVTENEWIDGTFLGTCPSCMHWRKSSIGCSVVGLCRKHGFATNSKNGCPSHKPLKEA